MRPPVRWGGTALADAVRHGHAKVAHKLFSVGGSLGFDQGREANELCEAARNGSLETMKLLLQCGCSPNAADYDRRAAIHLGASEGNILIVGALLEAKANINCEDRWNGTPLSDSVREGHLQVSQLLHRSGGELGFDEAKASGELCELARKGDLERLKMLLDFGAKVDAVDCTRYIWLIKRPCSAPPALYIPARSLSLSVCRSDVSSARCSLSARVRADDNRSALHLAASEGNMTVVSELMKRQENVSMRDRWGGTPLQDAVREGHSGVVKMLVQKKADLGYDEVSAMLLIRGGYLCSARTRALACSLCRQCPVE